MVPSLFASQVSALRLCELSPPTPTPSSLYASQTVLALELYLSICFPDLRWHKFFCEKCFFFFQCLHSLHCDLPTLPPRSTQRFCVKADPGVFVYSSESLLQGGSCPKG